MRGKNQSNDSPRGRLLLASCRSGTGLLDRVVERYQDLLAKGASPGEVLSLRDVDYQFSDTETCVRLDLHVGGYDVFLLQALYDPRAGRSVDENYAAFLIAARTFREHGARHVTAVLPYLAYARQDKPTKFEREPTTAKLMADLTVTAGVDRVITWHPHSQQIQGFYGRHPVDVLEALALFVDEFRRFEGREDVIAVAPDAGASKFVTYFARALGLRSAITSKYRPYPEEATISEVIGDFAGKRIAIVLDDMVSSGGTMEAIVKKLVAEKDIQEVYLGVSHNLCTENAYERFLSLQRDYALQEVIVTNSIPQTERFQELPFLSVRELSQILARVVYRVHHNRSVSELFERGSLTES